VAWRREVLEKARAEERHWKLTQQARGAAQPRTAQ
jgi:hypothetical protein